MSWITLGPLSENTSNVKAEPYLNVKKRRCIIGPHLEAKHMSVFTLRGSIGQYNLTERADK